MKHEIIEIDKTSELFPRALIEIGDDCPEKLYLMGNVELLNAETGGGRNVPGHGTILPAARLSPSSVRRRAPFRLARLR